MREIGILVLMIWMGLISCADEMEEQDNYSNERDEVFVRLVVSRPDTKVYTGGETINEVETTIKEIQLLVFEEGVYKYRVPGISITNSGTTTSFSARLLASDKMLDLYIVANATASVLANEPVINEPEPEVRAKLQAIFPVSGSFSFLPMLGRYNLASGLQANQPQEITGISMLRAVARADVLVANVPGFELTSVQAYRANERIQLISDQEASTVTEPSIPVNSRTDVNTTVISVSGNQAVAELYLPESAAVEKAAQVTGATCIVIGGKYGGSEKVTYYRIDFNPDQTSGNFGQILRNHCYIFTIRSVAGPGWTSADEAANNRSAQINLEITTWDESTTDMHFDTEHYFGLSTREVVLGSKQNALTTVLVNTDIPDYMLQWSDEAGNVLGTASAELTNAYFKVRKVESGDSLLVTALQNNGANNSERTGYFVISANRWRILMTIRQSVSDMSVKAISLLSFRNSLGYLGMNYLLPVVTPDSRGAGTAGILGNLNNFGPSGTVVCAGFNLFVSNMTTNAISDASLAAADIVYFNYVSNSALNRQNISAVQRWLKASKNRVLIVSMDGSDVNVPLLTDLLGNTNNINWFTSNTGPFPLVEKSATNFFTDTGPFTVSPYTPVASGFSFQNYDAYHGEIGAGSAAGITPILNGPGGGIVLGIDMSRRIIYMGDIDLNTAYNGTGSSATNHINNTIGTINNDAAKLIANVFAWAAGVVIGE